jgi:hypothetical protein
MLNHDAYLQECISIYEKKIEQGEEINTDSFREPPKAFRVISPDGKSQGFYEGVNLFKLANENNEENSRWL